MKTQTTITTTNAEEISTSVYTTDELRKRALRSSLLLVLSDFPENMSNEWIIDGILNDDERIVVWEPFENWDRDVLVTHIEETEDTIYNTYFQ